METSQKYFTSDPHLDHEAAIEHNTRPFQTLAEMQYHIIGQYNTLPKGSVLYILGDLLVRKGKKAATKLLNRLPNHISYVFVVGNHDHPVRELLEKYGRVVDLLQITHEGRKIVLCHYPMYEWSSGHHGSILLHGHTHGRMEFPGITLDVGWDVHSRPISADDVIEQTKNMTIFQPVHNRNNGKTYSELLEKRRTS